MKTRLFLPLLFSCMAVASNPVAVETFNNMSLYWKASGGSNVVCKVEYRMSGDDQWMPALDMWWAGNEYRGSVLNLNAGTEYEFRLKKEGEQATVTKSTWADGFRIASEKQIRSSRKGISIIEGGSEESGYVVYDFKEAIIDAGNNEKHCLVIDADYVVVRNGSFLNAVDSAIVIEKDRHHVVIEGVVVENWGHRVSNYKVSDRIGGISLREGCSQIVVQGCRIRSPRFDAWDWTNGEGAPAGENHPHGAFGIACPDEPSRLSNNVFRYNLLQGKLGHRLEDGMGAFSGNFSEQGFPGPDSDIYGNRIEYCVDNGIESEGGGMNVRVYENYIDHAYTPLGTKAVSLGPAYFIRNVAWRSLPTEGRSMKFFKAGGEGMRYFLHNMTLSDSKNSFNRGIDTEGSELLARNNLFVICEDGIGSEPFSIGSEESSDFDYNLSSGAVNLKGGVSEAHGVRALPRFRDGHGPGRIGKFQLSQFSPGYDQGIALPNVNMEFEGKAPDMGAHEFGSPDMLFGPAAWKKEN